MHVYPRMMYRSGTSLHWEGLDLDTQVVADEDEEQTAAAEGWRVSPHPLDHDGDNRPGGSLPTAKRRKRKVTQ